MEHYRIGQHVKAYVLEVRRTTKGPQIYVSRTHKGFLRRLFELEVPEIHSGTVEIKAIAREAGSRSKVAVASRQEGLDPVGATVGQRGGRVQAVVAELGGEKIDVIPWSDDPASLVANALSPAQVVGVSHRRGGPHRHRDGARADALAGHRPGGPERPPGGQADRLAHRHPVATRRPPRRRRRRRARRPRAAAGRSSRPPAAAAPILIGDPAPTEAAGPSRPSPHRRPPPHRQTAPESGSPPDRREAASPPPPKAAPPRCRHPRRTAAHSQTTQPAPRRREATAQEHARPGRPRRSGPTVAPRGASRRGRASRAAPSAPKRELVRVVRTPDGDVAIDPTGRRAGRGAYLCAEAPAGRPPSSAEPSSVPSAPIPANLRDQLKAGPAEPDPRRPPWHVAAAARATGAVPASPRARPDQTARRPSSRSTRPSVARSRSPHSSRVKELAELLGRQRRGRHPRADQERHLRHHQPAHRP